MNQNDENSPFQTKWEREKKTVKIRHKSKRRGKKNFFVRTYEAFINKYKSIIKELTSKNPLKKKSRSSKKSSRSKNINASLSNKSIIFKALKNSKTDIFNVFKKIKFQKKTKKRSEVHLMKKLRKKKIEKITNELKNFITKPLNFKNKKISKDTIAIGNKIKHKRAEKLKARLQRYAHFKFRRPVSISERMQLKELRERRIKKIKDLKIQFLTFPQRSLINIRKSFKKALLGIKNIKSNWRKLRGNIHRINKDEELKEKFLFTYFNSTVAFLFTFFLMYFLHLLITNLLCSSYSIPTILYYFDIVYQVGPYSYLWNRFNILVIHGSAPFFSLLLSVLFYRLYLISKTKFKYLRIFFLWGMINAFNMFFGAYIVGAITRSGFVYFTEWLFFSDMFDVEEIIFMACSFIAMISIGYYAASFFLNAAENKELISLKNKNYYKYIQVFLPWLTGIIIILLFNIPNITINIALYCLTLLLMLIPVIINYENSKYQQFTNIKTKRKYSFLKWSIITTIFLIITLRFVLNDGIWFK